MARLYFVRERGLRVTRGGETMGRIESRRTGAVIVQRMSAEPEWIGAIRLEGGSAPLLAASDGQGVSLDGRTRAVDLAASRRVGGYLVVGAGVLTSSDRFSGAVSGISDLLAPGLLTPVSVRHEETTWVADVLHERDGRAWQFTAERLDWRLPVQAGSGPTRVTLRPEAQGEGYRLRREWPLSGSRLVLEGYHATAAKETPITLPTFAAGRLENRYRATTLSAGLLVPSGSQGGCMRVALVRRTAEFSAAGQATVPASLGGLPGDSLTFALASTWRSDAVHVGAEWPAGPGLKLRAGLQYLRARCSAAGDYRLINLLGLRPLSSDTMQVDITDGRVLFVGAGAFYSRGSWQMDAGVARAFPKRSRDLDAVLPHDGVPGGPRSRTTGGLLFAAAVTRTW